jgi:branched-chain amino acid transport system permease protein
VIGAIVYRLLDFGLRRYLGEGASFVNGAIYVLIVLFLPYGIVGSYRIKSWNIQAGYNRLLRLFRNTDKA